MFSIPLHGFERCLLQQSHIAWLLPPYHQLGTPSPSRQNLSPMPALPASQMARRRDQGRTHCCSPKRTTVSCAIRWSKRTVPADTSSARPSAIAVGGSV
jgi:hypothetical protein